MFTNSQVILAPAGRQTCPQSGMIRLQNQPHYPMKVVVALDQLTSDKSSNAPPADAISQASRCRPEASRIFTKLFSIPGAVADSFLIRATHPDEGPPMGSKLVGAATGRIYVSV
ncbi:hypothetical protein RR46_12368 [Papilio xuthus]|uniref:Uncharacterized protein n=1 Tax=Papilio xuthus TaxID=66420 RepID=A0A194PTN6_PAPXU|nr:hypothetical protein RR46_12368 [Papilio xuthus]